MNVQSAPILNTTLSSPAVFSAIFASFLSPEYWNQTGNFNISCRSHAEILHKDEILKQSFIAIVRYSYRKIMISIIAK